MLLNLLPARCFRRFFTLASRRRRPLSSVAGPLFFAVVCLFGTGFSSAQNIPGAVDPLTPASTGGVAAVDRALARLSTHKRLLMIAAHPDDEDTFVLAHVSRALGGEAAYLSLTRGDGGQNLIGSELGEGLGLLRSRELESARRIDGARQYFTRAFDFGYTRSMDETFQRWPKDQLMADARAVVQRFKPQVLVAVFPTDARAGHGQHQVSAVVAEELFAELPRDPAVPGSVQSFFRAAWWNPEAATVEIPLGTIDPHTGRSTFQTALASRSRHRCQDMGFEQPPGDATARLIWQGGRSDSPVEDLFAETDTRLAAIAAPLLSFEPLNPLGRRAADTLAAVETRARSAREALVPARPRAGATDLAWIVTELSRLHDELRQALGEADQEEAKTRLQHVSELVAEKLHVAREGFSAAAGVVVDVIADRAGLVSGEPFDLRLLLWLSGSADPDHPIDLSEPTLELLDADAWQRLEEKTVEESQGRFQARVTHERLWSVRPAPGAEPSAPYFLRQPRDGDLYRWPEAQTEAHTLPFEAPPLRVRVRAQLMGVDMEWTREVVYRFRDQALGEIRNPLRRVRDLEVMLDRRLVVRPSQERRDLELRATLVRHSESARSGALKVRVPEGWPRPDPVPFRLEGEAGQQVTLDLKIPLPDPLPAGRYQLEVHTDDGLAGAARVIDYEHIRPALQPTDARLELASGDIRLPRVDRVAYLRGASDRVPEMLRQVGLPITLVSAEELLTGDLGAFDAVVIGSRAFEVEPLLAKANDRLLEFARAGGTVLVQYQQYQYVRGGFPPFPLDIHRPHDRVTDETAAVRLLRPEHEFFRSPNALGEEDWRGWVQERGLYFAGQWGEQWTPLLAMTDPIGDPGGDEKHGALLVADLGEGRYIYTGLAFFRQLPNGVVGAYRLLLNLLQPRSPGS